VQAQALEGLHLTGVFTGAQGGGFATLLTRSGEVHAFPGDEVVPGIILKQIEGSRVILLASGIEKELKLRESDVTAASPQAVVNRPPQAVQATSK
jgi:hypothetical protein